MHLAGQDIQLTVTEFLLVKALAARPGMVKSRDQLIDAAYGENIYVDDRTIDSHVKRIRKKFRTGTTIQPHRDAVRHRLPLQGAVIAATAPRSIGLTAGRHAAEPAAYRCRQRWVSPLLRRILLVNALPLALLVVALLYLDQYQNGLLEAAGRGAARAGAGLRRRAGGKRGAHHRPRQPEAGAGASPRPLLRRLTEPTPDAAGQALCAGRHHAGRFAQVREGPAGTVTTEPLPPAVDHGPVLRRDRLDL